MVIICFMFVYHQQTQNMYVRQIAHLYVVSIVNWGVEHFRQRETF